MNERAKRWSVVVVVVLLGLAAWQAACSSSSDLPPGPTTNDGGNNEETTLIGDGGASALAISPQNPAVDVTINNGVITTAPLTFTASSNGAPVSPSWSLDRGELGAIGAANGVFTASGNVSGDGVITATLGSAHASTTITVRIHAIQNGGDACPDGGAGGCGGVGGEGLGGPVDPPTIALLRGPANAPANAAELGFLYPYDQTVWPRGLLAPLLQWQTTHSASAVYVHLTQKNYEFEGFYSGKSLVHQPIDATGWKQATYGNGGDPLHAELKIADSGKAYGPIAQDWSRAGHAEGNHLLHGVQQREPAVRRRHCDQAGFRFADLCNRGHVMSRLP